MNKFFKISLFLLILGTSPMVWACDEDENWEGNPALEKIYGENKDSKRMTELKTAIGDMTTVDPNKAKGTGSYETKSSKQKSGEYDYLNNEDSVMENRNKLRLNVASQAVSLGQHAVALATVSGDDVNALQAEIEGRDDVLRMLKGIAKLQAQHLQKTNAVTAMRAKLAELSATENIMTGSIYTTRTSVSGSSE